MPATQLKALAKKYKIPMEKMEEFWEIAKKEYGKDWEKVMGTVKKMAENYNKSKNESLLESKVITIKKDSFTGEYRVPGPNNKESEAYYTDDKTDAIETAKDMYKRLGFEDIEIKFKTVQGFDNEDSKKSNVEKVLNKLKE